MQAQRWFLEGSVTLSPHASDYLLLCPEQWPISVHMPLYVFGLGWDVIGWYPYLLSFSYVWLFPKSEFMFSSFSLTLGKLCNGSSLQRVQLIIVYPPSPPGPIKILVLVWFVFILVFPQSFPPSPQGTFQWIVCFFSLWYVANIYIYNVLWVSFTQWYRSHTIYNIDLYWDSVPPDRHLCSFTLSHWVCVVQLARFYSIISKKLTPKLPPMMQHQKHTKVKIFTPWDCLSDLTIWWPAFPSTSGPEVKSEIIDYDILFVLLVSRRAACSCVNKSRESSGLHGT